MSHQHDKSRQPNKSSIDSLMDDFFDKNFTITDYQLIPYNLRLKTPWKTSSSSLSYRQGLLVKLTGSLAGKKPLASRKPLAKRKFSVTGECAPMPEIGTESIAQAQDFLYKKLPALKNSMFNKQLLSAMKHFPACRFALESALLQFMSSLYNKSIAQLLNPQCELKVKTNSMIGPLDESVISRAEQAQLQGFKCIKIKLGMGDIKTEAKRLVHLLTNISASTLIRLDANKSWSSEETNYLLDVLTPYQAQIDCIEEPLKNYQHEDYKVLQSQTSIALALDESFSATKIPAEQFKTFPVNRLVLKPMAQGGIINTLKLAKQAQSFNIETVITSSIESGYGLWIISHLCAAVNNNQYHGIATGSWLEETIIKPPEIKHGIITL